VLSDNLNSRVLIDLATMKNSRIAKIGKYHDPALNPKSA
jgi:hypothetical protein